MHSKQEIIEKNNLDLSQAKQGRRRSQPAENTQGEPEYRGVSKGERNSSMMSYLGLLRKRGADEEELRERAREANQLNSPPLSDREVESLVKSAVGYPKGRPRVERARRNVDNVLSQKKDLRQRLFDEEIRSDLVVVRQEDPETWVRVKHASKGFVRELERAVKKSSLRVVSPSGEGVQDENTMKAAINRALAPYWEAGATPDYSVAADAAYGWLREDGAQFFRTRSGEPYMSYDRRMFWLNSSDRHRTGEYEALLHNKARLLQTSVLGRAVKEGIRHACVTHGQPLDQVSSFRADIDAPSVYVCLHNDENEIVTITSAGVTVVQNGANPDRIFLTPSPKIEPISYIPDIKTAEVKQIIQDHFIRSLACHPTDAAMIFYWLMSFLLIDFASTRPILRCEGDHASGKTLAAKKKSTIIYGQSLQSKITPAAAFSDAERNPLQLWDNFESAQATPEMTEFLLITATGAVKEKRKKGTDSDVTLEKPRALVAMTGIDSIGADLSEVHSRMFVVPFSPDYMQKAGFVEQSVLSGLRKHRDTILSWTFQNTARVLALIRDGHLQNVKRQLDLDLGGHSKQRCHDYLALMYLFAIASDPADEQREKLAAIDPGFKAWILNQHREALASAAASNPIATALLTLFEKMRHASLGPDSEKRSFLEKYQVRPDDPTCLVDVTARQLWIALKALSKDYNLVFPISSPRSLGKRLSSERASIAGAGVTVETRMAWSRTILYNVHLTRDGEFDEF